MTPAVLRSYQTDVVAEIESEIAANKKKLLLLAPTGGGKTVVFCEGSCANPSFCDRTQQTTVEAIMFAIRARGVAALKEPATMERLSRCDAAALAQIDQRITKLRQSGRLR